MKFVLEFVILIIALLFIYFGSLSISSQCDILENTIDTVISGAAGTKQMLDGNMDLMSYIRHIIAGKLKNFYDNSECYDN